VPSPSLTPPPGSPTPPRSVSPPGLGIKRRQSHPPSSGHQPRKSGSKLRSVLSVIDESLTRHADSAEEVRPTEPTPPSSAVNGNTQVQDTSWGAFSYGESPYGTYIEGGNATPRHSSLYTQPPATQYSPEPPQSHTPQPDETPPVTI
jgi:hypothetical protein